MSRTRTVHAGRPRLWGVLVAALVAGCGGSSTSTASTPDPTVVTSASTGPSAATCVSAWNRTSNAASQRRLIGLFAGGGRGRVIAGSQSGRCVVAAYRVPRTTYVVYRQSGVSFATAAGGAVAGFDTYRRAIRAVNVVVQSNGTVKAVR